MVWRRILIQELSLSWGDLVVRLKNLDYNVHIHGEFCGNVSIKIFESGDPLHQSHHLCVEVLGVFACHPWILYWQESIKVGIRGYECTQGGNNKPLVLRYILLTPVIHFCYPVPPTVWGVLTVQSHWSHKIYLHLGQNKMFNPGTSPIFLPVSNFTAFTFDRGSTLPNIVSQLLEVNIYVWPLTSSCYSSMDGFSGGAKLIF